MSLGSKQYSASIAFTLALFSHLVNHVNIRLQAELEEGESQVPPLHTDATGERGNPRKRTCMQLQVSSRLKKSLYDGEYGKPPSQSLHKINASNSVYPHQMLFHESVKYICFIM